MIMMAVIIGGVAIGAISIGVVIYFVVKSTGEKEKTDEN